MNRSRQLALSAGILAMLLIAAFAWAAPESAPRAFVPVQAGFTTQSSTSLPYAPDRLLVQFTTKAMSNIHVDQEKGARPAGGALGLADIDDLAAQAGVVSIERPYRSSKDAVKAAAFGKDRWFMFRFNNAGDLPTLAAAFRADKNVEAVSLDWRAYPATSPNDPMYPDQWGHNNTGQMLSYDWATYTHTGPAVGTPGFDSHAEEAWGKSQGYGSGAVIAILDSGADTSHPDLNLLAGYDFGDNDSNPDDDSDSPGHGTCCSGVAAAVANNNLGVSGIAGAAAILPCKVADSGGSMYFSYIQDALYWAADNGADVISMSFGAAISSDAATDAALQYAYNKGVTLFAATGNENASTISYPAINQYVIGVGAASPCGDRKRSSSKTTECNPGVNTDPNGYTCDGERWWGSNYGSTTPDAAGAVDILAPTIIPTTDISGNGGYESGDYDMYFNGTSAATPYAAGCAALVIAANPTFTPAQVRDALTSTATDIVNVESGSGWDRYSGYGMVNVDAAIGGGSTPVAPTADFTGTPTSGDYPLNVAFTDASSGAPTSWSWDFGDGGSSTAQNPTHTYNAAGTYTVALTVSNTAGSDTATKTDYITVTSPPPPVAAFSGSPTSGTYPLDVVFTDESTGSPTSWSWTFGDGGTSTAQNPTHTYNTAGTYDVSLSVSNDNGSDSLTKTGYITVTEPGSGSWVTITYDDFEGGWGNYTDGGGDCSLYTSGTYAHQGSNAADIQDNSGVASSFYHTNGYDVSGYSDLEVEFWYEPVSMDRTGEDFWVQYYDGSTWQTVAVFDKGVDFENNNFYHEVVSIPAGTYAYPTDAKLRFMCDASGNVDDVYIDEIEFRGYGDGSTPNPPVAAFSGSPISGTAPLAVAFTDESTGSPTSWSWTFGDGGTSTAQNPSHTYGAAGTYTVALTVTNAGGNDTMTKTDYITVTDGGSGTWQTITYDDFEGGWGSYTDGGGDCLLYTSGTYAHQGSNAGDIQDNSGVASSFYHTNGHDVSAYVDLEVEFWYRPESMDRTGEDFWVQYYDGSAWRTVAVFDKGVDFENKNFYHEVVSIPAGTYTYPTNAKLRFMCDASGNKDDVYIDEIEFRGLTAGGSGEEFDVQGGENSVPSVVTLEGNYPNPFNPMTTIKFSLPAAMPVTLTVYNVRGQVVSTLVRGNLGAGSHTVNWEAADSPSGVYFYRLVTPGFSRTGKMIMLK